MSNLNELPLVLWAIACFDRRREKPFPVYNRQFVLDWEALTEPQVVDVLAILDRNQPDRPSPSGFETSVISIERSPSRPDDRMLAYRQHFKEMQDGELESHWQGSSRGFTFVNLNREYFEDENGSEVSHYDMIRHVSGQDEPIIVGDPDSILRLGLSSPREDAGWTTESANAIAQFLDVVKRVCNSEWYARGHSLTFEVQRGRDNSLFPELSESKLLEAVFPNDKETMGVLAYFRQLHAGDKLLIRACDTYVQTCSDGRKNWWINERKEAFKRTVDSPPVPFNVLDTRRDILRMFMYGAGLLHATSNTGDDAKLANLIDSHGKERAVTIFNSCLFDFLSIAVDVFRVVSPDYEHWLDQHSMARPTRVEIPNLFDGFRAQQW